MLYGDIVVLSFGEDVEQQTGHRSGWKSVSFHRNGPVKRKERGGERGRGGGEGGRGERERRERGGKGERRVERRGKETKHQQEKKKQKQKRVKTGCSRNGREDGWGRGGEGNIRHGDTRGLGLIFDSHTRDTQAQAPVELIHFQPSCYLSY